MSIFLDVLLLATGCAHVLISPYTKVEESFNLHATHDVLMYGVGPTSLYNYDHFTFPGAVPRTFIGSVLLAWLSTPVIHLAAKAGYVSSKFDLQIIIRLVLALLNGAGLALIRRAVSRRFGRPVSLYYTLLTITQFHVPFWMGRTLPNMFALFPVNLAIYLILDRAPASKRPLPESLSKSVALFAFTSIVFRSEVMLLALPFLLQFIYLRYMGLRQIFRIGLISSVISIGLTVLSDSYFWDSPSFIWPEFAGLYFNVYQGKSAEWGVAPYHTYISTYLPRILLASFPLSFLGYVLDSRVRRLLLPALIYIATISCLGHKEWRFIIYIVPIFNVAAARALRSLFSQPKSHLFGRLMFTVGLGLIIGNILLTTIFTWSSMANYPGGHAISFVNTHLADYTSPVHIHISNLAAQTGASLFTQIHSPPFPSLDLPVPLGSSLNSTTWIYNKTENISLDSLLAPPSSGFFSKTENSPNLFTHLLTEEPLPPKYAKQWNVIHSEKSFDGWAVDKSILSTVTQNLKNREMVIAGWKNREEILRGARHSVSMRTKEVLWVLERK